MVLVLGTASQLAGLLIPLSIAAAILRYRLWEIDALINKVLVYGLLTVLLAAVYAGLILGLQALLQGVIQTTNDIALVISTLVIAALFQPLRQRIQTLIAHVFIGRSTTPLPPSPPSALSCVQKWSWVN